MQQLSINYPILTLLPFSPLSSTTLSTQGSPSCSMDTFPTPSLIALYALLLPHFFMILNVVTATGTASEVSAASLSSASSQTIALFPVKSFIFLLSTSKTTPS